MMNHYSQSTAGTPPRHAHSGLSLVELMVAMVIGLILMAGVIQIFMSSRSSYAMQEGMGRLQENSRYVISMFNTQIGKAGYNITSQALDPNNGSVDGGGNMPDSIEISFASPTDCLGNATPSGVAVNKYYIANNKLMCLGNGNANAGTIVDGVENMQILYGVDTSTPKDKIANEYINASEVTSTQWADKSIVAVRIALLFSTVTSVNSGKDNNTYVLLDAPAVGPAKDMLKRRVYTRTFLLRNNQP